MNQSLIDAANTGHGHVRERPDGHKAKCGGVGICAQCSAEACSALGEEIPIEPPAAITPENDRETEMPKIWVLYHRYSDGSGGSLIRAYANEVRAQEDYELLSTDVVSGHEYHLEDIPLVGGSLP